MNGVKNIFSPFQQVKEYNNKKKKTSSSSSVTLSLVFLLFFFFLRQKKKEMHAHIINREREMNAITRILLLMIIRSMLKAGKKGKSVSIMKKLVIILRNKTKTNWACQ
jgi:hypothetical protein